MGMMSDVRDIGGTEAGNARNRSGLVAAIDAPSERRWTREEGSKSEV